MIETAHVPCRGCTVCCERDLIPLQPEDGDPAQYETDLHDIPGVGAVHMLQRKPDGTCVYLGPQGCTIHARAPAVCKAFDCRKFFLSKTRNQRRQMIKAGHASKQVFDEGRKRLHTLKGAADG